MAIPATREDFKQYCLRKLGAPVIEINVADEQIEDRIDEAIKYWNDYHFDGAERLYLKHQLTQTDIDNGYVNVDANLVGIVRIFDLGSSLGTRPGMFNAKYQFVLSNISNMSGFKMSDYFINAQNLNMMNEILNGRTTIRYSRHVNKLYLDETKSKLTDGNWIIIEAYAPLDETTHTDMWADRWLQNYTTTLIKEQWGTVLTKFTGMQLPGGVQFNGEMILNDARDERRKLEEEMISSYSLPVMDFIG